MSKKYALIIANTEYMDDKLSQLTAPGKDAHEFARVIDSPDICAFDEVTVVFNEIESKVSEAIDHFCSNRKPSDLLLLYFSGHGLRDEYGALYLAVKNTNRTRLRSTAIKSDYIREAMDQSMSKRQVLILDCCNSGAFAQGAKALPGGPMGMNQAFQGFGRFVLTASDATQFAWEGDKIVGEIESSLFTNFLVKGLEGEADSNGDGCITVDELYEYAYEQTVSLTPKQTPGKWSYKQQGEIMLRENIRKPIPLPEPLAVAINSPSTADREGAVAQLAFLLQGQDPALAHSAKLALKKMVAEDDSRRVTRAATKALGLDQDTQQQANKFAGLRSSFSSGQLRIQQIEQDERHRTELKKFQQEKEDLEKQLQQKTNALEKLDAQLKAKDKSTTTSTVWKVISGLGIVLAVFFAVLYAKAAQQPGSIVAPTPTVLITATERPITLTEVRPVIPMETETTETATEAPTDTLTATEPPSMATATPSTPAPEIIDDKGVSMVLVSAGDFLMGTTKGDTDERPIHSVNLDAYYIDKYEVTNKLYQACVNARICKPPVRADSYTRSSYYGSPLYADYPVVYVDWTMAKIFCEWRDAKLPTEAQWEKAARSTDERMYPWGGEPDCRKANYHSGDNSCPNGTTKVGEYEIGTSPYGVYDMAGNVSEWVADWYSATYYNGSPVFNPTGPDRGQARALRGGSWSDDASLVRATNRLKFSENYTNFNIGFRCARDIPPAP